MEGNFTFKKQLTDDEGGFEIIYVNLGDGGEKVVNSDKPLYLEWLAEGNTPEEIAYVPLVIVDTQTPKQKRYLALRETFTDLDIIEALVEKTSTGSSAQFDEVEARITELKIQFPDAKVVEL